MMDAHGEPWWNLGRIRLTHSWWPSRYAVGAIMLGSAVLVVASLGASANEQRLLAYGKHLSGECSSCHRIDGIDNGIPSITGWATEDFVTTLDFYRNGLRPNPAMVSVAKSLDDEQVKALAAYYGSLPKPPKRSSTSR